MSSEFTTRRKRKLTESKLGHCVFTSRLRRPRLLKADWLERK